MSVSTPWGLYGTISGALWDSPHVKAERDARELGLRGRLLESAILSDVGTEERDVIAIPAGHVEYVAGSILIRPPRQRNR